MPALLVRARRRLGFLTPVGALRLRRGAGGRCMVVGLGAAGAMTSIAVTTVAQLTPADRRGGALGIMNAVVTAGLIAPTLIGHLVDTHGADGYRYAVLITGALLVLGGVAGATLIDPDRDAPGLSE